ncbi:MAG: hypothetical protein WCD56_20775 [Pseudolabrys sp.]|jgi:hypothetical protein
MRKIINIALVLGGTFVSMMAVPGNPRTAMVTNNHIYSGMTGLRVSLPSDMKSFPVELVPLP